MRRLDRLATRQPVGCTTCGGWTEVLLVGDDGPHRREQCPMCHRVVPVQVTVQLVGVALRRV